MFGPLYHCMNIREGSRAVHITLNDKERSLENYRLDEQVGFILRKANQRHTAIFAGLIPGDLTPMQFAAMARLGELGECSQNRLGRLIAIDAATIKGVVDRLVARNLVATRSDPSDRRRTIVALSAEGRELSVSALEAAGKITEATLEPLNGQERRSLLALLSKIA